MNNRPRPRLRLKSQPFLPPKNAPFKRAFLTKYKPRDFLSELNGKVVLGRGITLSPLLPCSQPSPTESVSRIFYVFLVPSRRDKNKHCLNFFRPLTLPLPPRTQVVLPFKRVCPSCPGSRLRQNLPSPEQILRFLFKNGSLVFIKNHMKSFFSQNGSVWTDLDSDLLNRDNFSPFVPYATVKGFVVQFISTCLLVLLTGMPTV